MGRELARDGGRAGVEVDIAPPEAEHLTTAPAGVDESIEERHASVLGALPANRFDLTNCTSTASTVSPAVPPTSLRSSRRAASRAV